MTESLDSGSPAAAKSGLEPYGASPARPAAGGTCLPFPATALGRTAVPAHVSETYHWAYLEPRNVRLLDRELVVSFILWGNHKRLRRAAFAQIPPGGRVLQAACVYGDFSPALARHVGPGGRLEVIDVAPIQVARCRDKLAAFPQASVRRADAGEPTGRTYDAVCCYFLLHELPDKDKRKVVDALLASVAPGGRAVFVDYHRPHGAHPLRLLMRLVFDRLEPFAEALWRRDVSHYATAGEDFAWRKSTAFGGLYQITTASRL